MDLDGTAFKHFEVLMSCSHRVMWILLELHSSTKQAHLAALLHEIQLNCMQFHGTAWEPQRSLGNLQEQWMTLGNLGWPWGILGYLEEPGEPGGNWKTVGSLETFRSLGILRELWGALENLWNLRKPGEPCGTRISSGWGRISRWSHSDRH